MALGKPIFFYDNLLKKYAVTVTTEDASYPKGNLFDGDLNSLYKPTGSGDLSISIDAGASVPVDVFCLGKLHNLSTVSATVALQYSATGAWAGEQVNAMTAFDPTIDNNYEFRLFTQISARYWRVRLLGMTGIPQIGELAFGARFTLPKWFADGFDDLADDIEKKVNVADGGQLETIKLFSRKVYPCRIKNIAVGTQAETDMIAWLNAVKDGSPFWMLYDLRGSYVADFVSIEDKTVSAPVTAMRRDFNFKLQQEL